MYPGSGVSWLGGLGSTPPAPPGDGSRYRGRRTACKGDRPVTWSRSIPLAGLPGSATGAFREPLAAVSSRPRTFSDNIGRRRTTGHFLRVDFLANGASAFRLWRRSSSSSTRKPVMPRGSDPPVLYGNTSDDSGDSVRARSSTSSAPVLKGTQNSRPAFILDAGIVHLAASMSISSQRAPRLRARITSR